jgi:HEAT repeat protein
MKKGRAVVVVVSALVVAFLFLLWGSEREPRFQGKTLSAWLLQGAWRPIGLTETQDEAVGSLVSCLTNKSWGVAVVAARWLGRIRMEPEVVVPALTSCLDAPDARVRCGAVQALGEFRGDAQVATPSVVRELSDPDNEVRAAAANNLHRIETDFLGH